MRRREFIAGLAGAAAWPLRAGAQPTIKRTRTQTVRWGAFFAELRRRGYSEGENLSVDRVAIEGGHAAGYGARLPVPQSINELVDVVEVVVVDTSHWAGRIDALKGKIPIVALVTDPIGEHLTSSLATPDRNITGITVDTGPTLLGKQLDLLLEAAPRSRHMACIGATWPYAGMRTLWSDAQRRGVTVQEFVVHSQFRRANRALNYADAFLALVL
jgi:hypothetical protein